MLPSRLDRQHVVTGVSEIGMLNSLLACHLYPNQLWFRKASFLALGKLTPVVIDWGRGSTWTISSLWTGEREDGRKGIEPFNHSFSERRSNLTAKIARRRDFLRL